METDRIEIKQSKSKNITGLLSCLGFVAESIFILINADEIGSLSQALLELSAIAD